MSGPVGARRVVPRRRGAPAARRACGVQLDSSNGARTDDDATRAQALKDLLHLFGEGAVVVPRFRYSYGSNISIGREAFVNANAFFRDDATITIGEHARTGPGALVVRRDARTAPLAAAEGRAPGVSVSPTRGEVGGARSLVRVHWRGAWT